MLKDQHDGALAFEQRPRPLGLALGVVLFVFGALGAAGWIRARSLGGEGWGPLVLALAFATLGLFTLLSNRGLRVSLDPARRTLVARPVVLTRASSSDEKPFDTIEELCLFGSSASVSLYAQLRDGGEVHLGRFSRTLPEREALQRWVKALREAIPSAKWTARDELATDWGVRAVIEAPRR